MRCSFFVLVILIHFNLNGQNRTYNKNLEGKIYSFAERMPEFPGGDDALLEYIQKKFNYTKLRFENAEELPSTIYLTLIVNKKGKAIYTSNNQTKNKSLIAESKRLISTMPRWKPARHKGKNVNCYIDVPLYIHLEN